MKNPITSMLLSLILTCLLSSPSYAKPGDSLALFSQPITDDYVLVRDSGSPTKAFYDYAPEFILENGTYHLYWCGGVSGDYILHAQSKSPTGPFHSSTTQSPNSYDVSLRPTGSADGFDGAHTCDPSVLKVGNQYFLYYGGLGKSPGSYTKIGVAVSSDGIHFNRANGGMPIVSPALTLGNPVSTYGAGQPSVLQMGSKYYMTFSDTTGTGVNPGNGAGQFVLRSSDPLFQRDLQELTARGWMNRAAGAHTAEFKFHEGSSVDWYFDRPMQKIVLASNRNMTMTDILIVDPVSFTELAQAELQGTWRDGPSLLKTSDHSSVPRSDCSRFNLMAAKGNSYDSVQNHVGSWNIAVSAAEFRVSSRFCANGFPDLSFPQQPSPLVNVYGFYQPASHEHFYSLNEQEGTQAGFTPTGIAFRLVSQPVPGSRPLYRCLIRNFKHFISKDSNCEGQVREGLYGYIYSYQADGTTPLFREYQSSVRDHFVTTNAAEGVVNGGFYIDDVLGYVP